MDGRHGRIFGGGRWSRLKAAEAERRAENGRKQGDAGYLVVQHVGGQLRTLPRQPAPRREVDRVAQLGVPARQAKATNKQTNKPTNTPKTHPRHQRTQSKRKKVRTKDRINKKQAHTDAANTTPRQRREEENQTRPIQTTNSRRILWSPWQAISNNNNNRLGAKTDKTKETSALFPGSRDSAAHCGCVSVCVCLSLRWCVSLCVCCGRQSNHRHGCLLKGS
jgi:hypothetical protein